MEDSAAKILMFEVFSSSQAASRQLQCSACSDLRPSVVEFNMLFMLAPCMYTMAMYPTVASFFECASTVSSWQYTVVVCGSSATFRSSCKSCRCESKTEYGVYVMKYKRARFEASRPFSSQTLVQSSCGPAYTDARRDLIHEKCRLDFPTISFVSRLNMLLNA